MNVIKTNPYRTVGLLVGATAREQERQVKRLKQFLEAEQEPQDDFSFPTLSNLQRTVDQVNEAASKLNLNTDKMNAALFWFYKGNPITDEPAFEACKEGDFDQAVTIWSKLTSTVDITQRNASAFSNLSTLYLSGALNGANTKDAMIEQGVKLKLKFLESDFIKDFKALATDETFKTTKKELQILFLNQLQLELENNQTITSNKFLEIIANQQFSAKEEFLKSYVQKPIEQIDRLISECKTLRKTHKKEVVVAGTNLFNSTKPILNQLRNILGNTNLKYTSSSDKVSDEVLQCGIQLFNDFREHKTYDPGEPAMKLFVKAKTLAIGSIAKQRCEENTENLQEWIDDKPERDKQKLIGDDLKFITLKLEKFQNLSDSVANAEDLIDTCKARLANIKKALGATDDLYLNVSNAIVGNAQGMLVATVNKETEKFTKSISYQLGTSSTDYGLKNVIQDALDATFKLGSLDMLSSMRENYKKNLEGIKSLAKQLGLSTLSPKERFQNELRQAESKLQEIKTTIYLKSELATVNMEMNKIKEWHFMRSQSDRDSQIQEQQKKIDIISKKSQEEKEKQISRQQSLIIEIKSNIEKIEY